MRIDSTKTFERELKKLPPDRRKAVVRNIQKFMQEPQLPSLKFRRFQGTPDIWIIDAHHGDRVLLRKIADDHYELFEVGPHDNVYRRMKR